jgi:hypothetical protein
MARSSRILGMVLLALPLSGAAVLSGSGVAGAEAPVRDVVVPTNAQFKQVGSSIVVAWAAPDSASAGSSVTAWVDAPSSDSCTADLAAYTCTINVSDPSATHEVFVQATDADGTTSSTVVDLGATDALTPVDPIPSPQPTPEPIVDPIPTPPPVLADLSAAAVDGGVVVTWTPASSSGYVYAWAANDDSSSSGWCWAEASSGTCQIAGLVDGQAHSVQLITEDQGSFGDMQDLGSFTPVVNDGAIAPSAPTLTDLAINDWSMPITVDQGGTVAPVAIARPAFWPGWGSLTASFDAPASDGGSPVRSVDVTATDSATGETTTCIASPTDSSCDLGDIRPGHSYTVVATATNGAGTSPASDPLSITIPVDPTMVDVTDVSATQDLATGAWWAQVALSTPAQAGARSLEVVDDQGDVCTVILAEGDTAGSCEIAGAGSDEPTGLTVVPPWIFPIAFDDKSGSSVDGTAAPSASANKASAAVTPDSVDSVDSVDATDATDATDAPTVAAPASSAGEPSSSSSPSTLEATALAEPTMSVASNHVVLAPATAASSSAWSTAGGIAILSLLLVASLLISLIRRSRA